MAAAPLAWFDGHLDLAYLVELGRDLHAPLDSCGGSLLPAAVTLPSLREGGVRACLGTIFTEAVAAESKPGPWSYPVGDAQCAHRAGCRQLAVYHAWRDAGTISLITPQPPGPKPHAPSLLLGILMECADPITTPDELPWWAERGVIAIGMAWWRGSRYAGGNGTDLGLSDLGRELAHAMDALGVVHDLTHLSQRATDELLAFTDRPVIASHSNCRALLGGRDNKDWQRHLDDETIREIGRRGGIVGVNLVRNFIKQGIDRTDPDDRPSIDDLVAHIQHVRNVMGHPRGVALGSDMDGGLTAHDLPRGIESPADLPRIADALAAQGWTDDEIHAFAWGNWARFWGVDGTVIA
ncbi:MAG: membrane dipeptidase [Phycisphaerales bacterium]|nr:membrane dipeptidase [Phycisphaerales bacterium]